ncbi:MAG: type VI secretion system baseplate subunit TssG [Treponema sp.]|jgi:type VI secretion system ImpH/TssG family protein|nr:type VI secretion system baseplate subunit TssG [Treponema sp.]
MENIRRLVKNLSQSLRQRISAPDFWGFARRLEKNNAPKPRLGYAKHPGEENVRFGQAPFLYFPSTDIAEIFEGKTTGIDALIITYFFGLLGVNGPMPLEFTSYVYGRSHNHYDNTWRRFLDIIHHRMLTHYYRAFAMNQQSISFDRPLDDPIRGIIKSLTALPPDINFGGKEDALTLSYANKFAFMVRNREGLEEILRRLLKTAVELRDFVIAPYDLAPEDYAVLGNPKTAILGLNLQIGRTFFSATLCFEVIIGPIDFNAYQMLMSGFTGFDILSQAVNLYMDRPLNYTLVFKLAGPSIPPARLGFDWEDEKGDASQLGYSCWIGSPKTGEVILSIDASRFNRKEHLNLYKTEATA